MEERRLIDLGKIKPMDFPSTEMDGLDVVRYLNTLPTVDAVEVVRCKDCKYRAEYFDSGMYVCKWHQCDVCGRVDFVKDEDFCSYAKRRTNDK